MRYIECANVCERERERQRETEREREEEKEKERERELQKVPYRETHIQKRDREVNRVEHER